MRKCSLSNLFQFCKINILDLSLCSSVENGGHIAKYQNVHKKKLQSYIASIDLQKKVSGGSKGGVAGARPPYGPNFSRFHAVFRKIWHNHMLAPPPTGNLDPPMKVYIYVTFRDSRPISPNSIFLPIVLGGNFRRTWN